ncbi:MAG: cob(I)yrinic acid a,c-diamide adenosyltransferase [Burkholderiaceae bacterium]|uniref:cob(I)yrinic acid a,c-diamide adenosyltransferase n=1 Tax=Herminiimonas sp. Marseille-P9896 TaxID=2742211 RepID=UPI00158903B5|nr:MULTISPECIES: cob(I)yrinic acid a,c-diamide adenosyltransferase [Oxalobacteraceae]MBX9800414.1 cob(I)yrinic acid a,c-diamide adenosyltransferase [Burkholderiaceae bacterium]
MSEEKINDADGLNERHNARMARKKEVVDKKIEAAKRNAGVIVITCGNGKGKSSSAFGMAARALGHGMKVGVVQFIKGAIATGEENFFRRFPDEISFHVMGEGYTWETQNRERDVANAEKAWQRAQVLLADPAVGLVVLDELNIALKYKYLDVQQVIADLQARPEMQHVVITGRGAPPELIAVADTVTEMQPIKHAFANGIAAQQGVEW